MRTLSKIALALCMGLIFVTAAAQPASAQDWLNGAPTSLGTPDGVPPSGETICAGQVGAAHGLCTAYCEAMDCDSGAPQASQKACDKVRANFLRVTGQAALPCDCPCMSQFPGFAEAVNGPVTSCFSGTIVLFPGFQIDAFILNLTDLPNPDPNLFYPATATYNSLTAACGNWAGAGIPITLAQAQVCTNILRQKAAAAGVTCATPPPI